MIMMRMRTTKVIMHSSRVSIVVMMMRMWMWVWSGRWSSRAPMHSRMTRIMATSSWRGLIVRRMKTFLHIRPLLTRGMMGIFSFPCFGGKLCLHRPLRHSCFVTSFSTLSLRRDSIISILHLDTRPCRIVP